MGGPLAKSNPNIGTGFDSDCWNRNRQAHVELGGDRSNSLFCSNLPTLLSIVALLSAEAINDEQKLLSFIYC